MHVLFLHQNFPAQFGQVAQSLIEHHDCQCSFVNEKVHGNQAGIDCIQYQPASGATKHSHFCSRTFENQIWRSAAVLETLRKRPDLQPDLIVAHSGFVSALFLRERYPDVPVVGYFEWYYHRYHSDFDFRQDLPLPGVEEAMRLRARNAGLLLDLQNCDAGYCPTDFQRSQLPTEYQPKLRTIFDGIDTRFWCPAEVEPREIAGVKIPDGHQVVTYVSRGFESMRGFDKFLQVADRLCGKHKNLTVIVVGEDRIAYGGDAKFTGGKSFKDWVIDEHDFDLSRVHFVGRVTPSELVRVFSASDLHLYWTVPFVLSWSLVNAMSCGCPILASDTAPVREMIHEGQTGRLADFFDVDRWVSTAGEMLSEVAASHAMGDRARKRIRDRYSLDSCLASMRSLYQDVVTGAI